jgi:hypothetical protein
MFPEAEMLPHLICSRPIFTDGANDEPDHQTSIFTRSARFERNTMTVPQNGSCSSTDCTQSHIRDALLRIVGNIKLG